MVKSGWFLGRTARVTEEKYEWEELGTAHLRTKWNMELLVRELRHWCRKRHLALRDCRESVINCAIRIHFSLGTFHHSFFAFRFSL